MPSSPASPRSLCVSGPSRQRLATSPSGARKGRTAYRPGLERLDARILPATGPIDVSGLTTRVGQLVNNLLAQDDIPGMAVAVTYQGQVVLAQGYGVVGDAARTPVGPDTPFGVGSLTKTFTALATLRIVQDPSLIDTGTNPGITSLQLDQPVSTYFRGPVVMFPNGQTGIQITLPSQQTFILPTPWAAVTTRQLLQMSSGLPDDLRTTPWYQVVEGLIQQGETDPAFTPGTQYLYSNDGYWLLGALVEQLTNVPYGKFVLDHIFRPLGMSDSSILDETATSVPGEAIGFDSYDPATNQGVPPPNGYYSGLDAFSAGAAVTSAADLGKYMSALWDQSSMLLNPTSFQLMWTPVPLAANQSSPAIATPGLGWTNIDLTPYWIEITKNGAVPGYSAQISIFKEDGFGIAVAYNLSAQTFVPTNPEVGSIIEAIHAAVDTAGITGSVVAAGASGAPLAGWQVILTSTGTSPLAISMQTTTTDSQGAYQFADVPPGQVTITVKPPTSGWWPAGSTGASITLVAQASGLDQNENFSFAQLVRVSRVQRTRSGGSSAVKVSFSGPLDTATALNRAAYGLVRIQKLVRRDATLSTRVPIITIRYDAATQSVILVPRDPRELKGRLQVEVIGSRITNTAGIPLDGRGDGTPGSNFVGTLRPRARRAADRAARPTTVGRGA